MRGNGRICSGSCDNGSLRQRAMVIRPDKFVAHEFQAGSAPAGTDGAHHAADTPRQQQQICCIKNPANAGGKAVIPLKQGLIFNITAATVSTARNSHNPFEAGTNF